MADKNDQQKEPLDTTRGKQKKEVKVAEKPKKSASSGKFKDIIEKIENLSALELSQLVKDLEEKFGVTATPAMAAAPAPAGGSGNDEDKEEEKAIVTIMLTAPGEQKINSIKAIREVTDLGLKEAKDLVDASASEPKEVKKEVKKEEADEIKKKLEAAGAKVEFK